MKPAAKQRYKTVYDLSHSWGFKVYEFAPNSLRLSKNGKVIDYFPKSNRCFWHDEDNDAWGDVTDIKGFLRFEFYEKANT